MDERPWSALYADRDVPRRCACPSKDLWYEISSKPNIAANSVENEAPVFGMSLQGAVLLAGVAGFAIAFGAANFIQQRWAKWAVVAGVTVGFMASAFFTIAGLF